MMFIFVNTAQPNTIGDINMLRSGSTTKLQSQEYRRVFLRKEKQALAQALDIRKFEIELYWKRASYFWTFIAAVFAGFFAVQASSSEAKNELSAVLSCLGVVFSFAWFCVNRGSKYWQENWEKHVDVLEDNVIGPLYKVVLSRNKTLSCKDKCIDGITGPVPLSVSKINQLISFYMAILWWVISLDSFLVLYEQGKLTPFYIIIKMFSVIACLSFIVLGKSYGGGYYHIATIRKSRIKPGNY